MKEKSSKPSLVVPSGNFDPAKLFFEALEVLVRFGMSNEARSLYERRLEMVELDRNRMLKLLGEFLDLKRAPSARFNRVANATKRRPYLEIRRNPISDLTGDTQLRLYWTDTGGHYDVNVKHVRGYLNMVLGSESGPFLARAVDAVTGKVYYAKGSEQGNLFE